MSIKRHTQAFTAMVMVAAGAVTVGTLSARAATPACGMSCISVFSKELGSPPSGPVEDVLDGVAAVGQPVILSQASGSDPSEDTVPNVMPVSAFYAAGMVSAGVDQAYPNLSATQLQYAPDGVRSGLCVGLAAVAYQDEGLTLQPCSVPAVTVWIIDKANPTDVWFPLINGSTTDFGHPFAMDIPQDEVASAQQLLQIHVRHLQFLGKDKTVPDRELWGVHPGPFN